MTQKSLTMQQLAELTKAKLVGNPQHCVTNVEGLEDATECDISFLANPRYLAAMLKSQAGAIFITPAVWEGSFADQAINRNFLLVENPSAAFQQAIEAFHGQKDELTGFEGIHSTAVVHPSASLGEGVSIGPHAVIDKDVIIGSGTFIGAGCYIGPCTQIGNDCKLHSNVTIRERCQLGNRVILQPGAVIGSCGFGYIPDAKGRHQKLNQLGTVAIGDDVEIGANTTIDRARFKTTEIKRGTKIDNLVQIGHGVVVGEDNIIIAQTGIAGSSKTGRHVILAGHVAVAGHLTLADGVVVAGCSGVTRSLKSAGKYGGVPAVPLQQYNRNAVHIRNIETTKQQIQELAERLAELEKAVGQEA